MNEELTLNQLINELKALRIRKVGRYAESPAGDWTAEWLNLMTLEYFTRSTSPLNPVKERHIKFRDVTELEKRHELKGEPSSMLVKCMKKILYRLKHKREYVTLAEIWFGRDPDTCYSEELTE